MRQKEAAIVGVGETDWSRNSGRSVLTLATEACTAAMRDAGLHPGLIDGLLCFTEADSAAAPDVSSRLGLNTRLSLDVLGGGSSPELLAAIARAAILEGRCEAVLCYRSMNGRSGKRMGNPLSSIPFPNADWLLPVGCTSAAAMFGLGARRHMHQYGVTREDLAAVAIAFRNHANRNPAALMYEKPLSLEEYFNSPWIVDPFCLMDCCLESDGAAAFIVTSADRVKDCANGGVAIRAVEGRTCSRRADYMQSEDITTVAGETVAKNLFRDAGYGPDEVDVASFYDCFTYTVLAQIEAYGFCARGEAGDFIRDGNLGIDGRLPSNTAGGQLSEGYTHGMNNLTEVVRQVRRDYAGTERQAATADIGLCTGWASPGVASAILLEAIR